jgi:hypothetical protein
MRDVRFALRRARRCVARMRFAFHRVHNSQ